MSRADDSGGHRADNILSSLSSICGPDAVKLEGNTEQLLCNGQTQAVVVVEPADETQTAAVMKRASAAGWTVKPLGAGTQMAGDGCGQAVNIALSVRRMNQVVEFSPADLVVTAQPGVPLSRLHTLLATEEKMLPLDPWLHPTATLGGVAATGASGPRRALYGTVRDMAIALRVVYPDGTVVRTGSKVVKNVAGYDMTKLFVGSRGTLGIITELTFKLRPMPLHRETVVLTGSAAQVQQIRSRLMASVLIFARAEAILGFESGRGHHDEVWTLAVDCDENELSAAYQALQLKAWATEDGMSFEVLHGVEAEQWWANCSAAVQNTDLRLRVAAAPVKWSELATCVTHLAAAAGVRPQQAWSVTAGTGRVYLRGVSADRAIDLVTELRAQTARMHGTVVIEHAHSSIRQAIDPRGPLGPVVRLFERIKAQVDPDRIMSPATFAGGI